MAEKKIPGILVKISNFFYPNKGIAAAFIVWLAFYLIALFSEFDPLFEHPTALVLVIILNAVVLYIVSCVSIWAYEKIKK